jgi:hypothetical protein
MKVGRHERQAAQIQTDIPRMQTCLCKVSGQERIKGNGYESTFSVTYPFLQRKSLLIFCANCY